MSRTDRSRHEDSSPTAEPSVVPAPRNEDTPPVPDEDGSPILASNDDRAIAEDMVREYGPAFARLADS